ncbi:MAG TPA: hypothetical protein VHJ83_05695, partial [Micromonosporaceae bacterium]|nr:hypothetical protein [Micromonosporaceae bacterium]
MADKRGGRTVAEGEFQRFTLGGSVKILDDPGDKAGHGCDCHSGPTVLVEETPQRILRLPARISTPPRTSGPTGLDQSRAGSSNPPRHR